MKRIIEKKIDAHFDRAREEEAARIKSQVEERSRRQLMLFDRRLAATEASLSVLYDVRLACRKLGKALDSENVDWFAVVEGLENAQTLVDSAHRLLSKERLALSAGQLGSGGVEKPAGASEFWSISSHIVPTEAEKLHEALTRGGLSQGIHMVKNRIIDAIVKTHEANQSRRPILVAAAASDWKSAYQEADRAHASALWLAQQEFLLPGDPFTQTPSITVVIRSDSQK